LAGVAAASASALDVSWSLEHPTSPTAMSATMANGAGKRPTQTCRTSIRSRLQLRIMFDGDRSVKG
jgi:hypothetical protein